jgi:hypothetical protein
MAGAGLELDGARGQRKVGARGDGSSGMRGCVQESGVRRWRRRAVRTRAI